MRSNLRRGLAVTAVVGLLLAGCGEDQDQEDSAEQDEQEQAEEDQSAEDQSAGSAEQENGQQQALEDPEENIEDGVYRGNGVALPVPDGWSVDPTALQQGVVAAVSEDGTEQMTAQALDAEQAGPQDEPFDLDAVLDNVRQQIDQEAATDEEVELDGAERAHRLTFRDLPAQQEGQPESSVTVVIAEGGDSLVGEFAYTAAGDDYDEEVASLLVDEAGFDPGSEPPERPVPQPAPEGDGGESEQPDSGE